MLEHSCLEHDDPDLDESEDDTQGACQCIQKGPDDPDLGESKLDNACRRDLWITKGWRQPGH